MANETPTAMINGIDTDALKPRLETVSQAPTEGLTRFHVTTQWKGGSKSETRVADRELGGQQLAKDFTICIDEPAELLGTNTAANPQAHLMAAMNACLMATFVAACAMQGIELEHLEIETTGARDLRGLLGRDKGIIPGYKALDYVVRIKGDGTAQQFEAVHKWVMATSPNYWNMAIPIRLNPRLAVE